MRTPYLLTNKTIINILRRYMYVMKIGFLMPVCLVFIFSCASISGKSSLYVNLTDSSKFVLLPTEGIEQDLDMPQVFSTEFRGQSYYFNAWVKANKNEIDMYFFNELGAGMGELSYRNGKANFSSNVIPKIALRYLKPEYIIACFQLSFYDPVLLENSLKNSGLVLEIKDGNRRILNGNEVVIDIKKTRNSVELVNHFQGYAYKLEGDFY